MIDDYRTAVTRFKLDAGPHYSLPVKKNSFYARGAWHLLNQRGDVICICGADGGCLWGNRLAVYFHEMTQRIPA